mmetsp:Transcript_22218/g.40031  ORF Transcript_22218/g.40031 Transcript_22218/m.40031 type:complete len:203 (+) Transcript_22218:80-688(+)|eukprot:CAMPEP_0197648378 /NCGR_PEP_ID=MMETSP1338-20131121/27718_1 /TAXON_ID=43686 ORGANISM="Pelagodinium beii, Strain RCC1491" /NCGR_SAMPLE_ID=MMETSP1338 /ASSEMBLY_ACC=CAM_ASM_000754 /LENGTH=202 /DNA_ID=CAMNT_0043222363 /DNA_START=75 /DNA_END=683 /DNA_ORIENTATION=-
MAAGKQMANEADWELLVRVQSLANSEVGLFEVCTTQRISDLKQAIRDAGGPSAWDQKLLLGHRVLQDDDIVADVLSKEDQFSATGFITLVTGQGCPDCSGSQCSLCECTPELGLIDYYGVCRQCKQSGGLKSRCPLCAQSFVSRYALDLHLKFFHPAEKSVVDVDKDWPLEDFKMCDSWQLPCERRDGNGLRRWLRMVSSGM